MMITTLCEFKNRRLNFLSHTSGINIYINIIQYPSLLPWLDRYNNIILLWSLSHFAPHPQYTGIICLSFMHKNTKVIGPE